MNDASSLETRRLVARLRFRHLQLLVELQRGGSLRAAAAVLNLTQPALSKALGEIEAAFGFPLFTRSARGLAPNPRGDIAIRGAALLLEELAHVGSEAAAEPATAVLRIGAPPFVAQGHLPEVFARLFDPERSDQPAAARVRVQLMEERVPLLLEALFEGRLDALISSYPAEMPDAAGPALRYEKLFDAEFVVIAPPGHALGRARRVDWQRLGREPWILPTRASMARRMVEDVFHRAALNPPVPLIESSSPVTNIRLVAAGLGIGVAPAALLRNADSLGPPVQRIRVQPPIASSPVALIYRAAPLNPRLDILREVLGLR